MNARCVFLAFLVQVCLCLRHSAPGLVVERPMIIIDNRSGPPTGPELVESSTVHKVAIARSNEAWLWIKSGEAALARNNPTRLLSDGTTKPTVYGHGINDLKGLVVDGTISNTKNVYYQRWREMLRRCYSEKSQVKSPTYKGVTVCPAWHYFSVFRAWMSAHDGYHEGNDLDKDLLVFDNKIYSPETCLFVPKEINSLLTNTMQKPSDEFAPGVIFVDGRFYAELKTSIEGPFGTHDEAQECYRQWKGHHIIKKALNLCNEQYNEPLRQALIRIALMQFLSPLRMAAPNPTTPSRAWLKLRSG